MPTPEGHPGASPLLEVEMSAREIVIQKERLPQEQDRKKNIVLRGCECVSTPPATTKERGGGEEKIHGGSTFRRRAESRRFEICTLLKTERSQFSNHKNMLAAENLRGHEPERDFRKDTNLHKTGWESSPPCPRILLGAGGGVLLRGFSTKLHGTSLGFRRDLAIPTVETLNDHGT